MPMGSIVNLCPPGESISGPTPSPCGGRLFLSLFPRFLYSTKVMVDCMCLGCQGQNAHFLIFMGIDRLALSVAVPSGVFPRVGGDISSPRHPKCGAGLDWREFGLASAAKIGV